MRKSAWFFFWHFFFGNTLGGGDGDKIVTKLPMSITAAGIAPI
jgi:hypothetical protein